jgi:hypothetical protein
LKNCKLTTLKTKNDSIRKKLHITGTRIDIHDMEDILHPTLKKEKTEVEKEVEKDIAAEIVQVIGATETIEVIANEEWAKTDITKGTEVEIGRPIDHEKENTEVWIDIPQKDAPVITQTISEEIKAHVLKKTEDTEKEVERTDTLINPLDLTHDTNKSITEVTKEDEIKIELINTHRKGK